LLFKGGTSPSKAFGLISRFSEDIDITVFREDLGEGATVEELEALSGKQRRSRLDAVKEACRAYINGQLTAQFGALLQENLGGLEIAAERFRLEADPDQQSLLFWYPAVTAQPGDYVRSAVKIESGARSALDPHTSALVKPYVDDDLPELDLTAKNATTIRPQRTFWNKVVIVDGIPVVRPPQGTASWRAARDAALLRPVPAHTQRTVHGVVAGQGTRA
jgi:hypothetical protein